MIATLTAFDTDGAICHSDTKAYPHPSFIWEHVGCQQNNKTTVRVHVETEAGLEYEVRFSPWTPTRRYLPSRRFRELLTAWESEREGM